jgi:hypothetical protein
MLHFMKSNEEGALTTLHCATSDSLAAESGKYYEECRARQPSSYALDTSLARTLWKQSCEMVGIDDPM